MKDRLIKLSLLVYFLLGLSACVSSTHLAEQRHERQVCEQRCNQRADLCQTHCHDDCYSCTVQAKKTAETYYQRYLKRRCVEGKTRILRMPAYQDPLQCLKKSCDCPDDYRVCMAACSGIIPKRLQREITCC